MKKVMTTVEKLDQLSEFQVQRDLLQADMQKLLDEAIPPEVKARLAEINAEFSGKSEAVTAKIGALEAEIRAEVKAGGVSVKGANLQAVYNKGRVSWDSKNLDGFAVTHPEILFARTEGEPSVTLRAVKGN